jgi:glycosyltransferase involved in cell wall biosynthesis
LDYNPLVTPLLSLIIPTHRRPQILQRTLEHIENQTIRDQLEVIVVSDGEDAKTSELFSHRKEKVPVTFFSIPKSHQGVARNRGVEKARGKFCLFIGDDIFLQPEACEAHLKHHQSQSLHAVLGFTTWDPSLTITPVMRWLEQSGWQFGYPMLAPYAHAMIPRSIQHTVSYTSHISLPTKTARAVFFREDVTLYGWEDIEWGMRLCDAGVKLFYEPDAKAFHHHHMSLEQSLKRMETLGKSARVMQEMVPGFDRMPTGWKLLAYRLTSILPTMAGKHRRAFLHGLQAAQG